MNCNKCGEVLGTSLRCRCDIPTVSLMTPLRHFPAANMTLRDWFAGQALIATVRDGELYTRYHFAALVAKAERKTILKLLDDNWYKTQDECAAAIRARGDV